MMVVKSCELFFQFSNSKYGSYVTCTKYQRNLVKFITFLSLILLIFLFECHHIDAYLQQKDETTLDSCQRCKLLVKSFKKGLKHTARGKHEGGDAHWEENKLNNYADSEIRLTEIQENLCNDVKSGKDQCHSFAEHYESEIEDWFLKNRKQERKDHLEEGSTLYEYLCNQISQACCPDGHFGADCQPCHGYPNNVCYNRGYCSGNGTRKGQGNCICHIGFDGEFCEKCSSNYLAIGIIEMNYEEKIQNIPEQCIRCDQSCASSCHSLGPQGCHVCRTGYFRDNDKGCIDIDECNVSDVELNPCKFQTYCMNTQGSYKCYPCHESCEGCTGHGSNSCIKCSSGYKRSVINNDCIRNDQYSIGQLWKRYVKYIRYVFYLIAMIIIFIVASRNNILLAACFSLITSIIITFIEKPDLLYDYL
uniref:Cysteine-rich with EGF-like domain protein 2 n=1 Tax=Dermatophagoides pteronyssinus TaxID=6956 RepID=A0A6P6XTP1_DERPT|nr:cysteine-rich with EGF-like domain protein 2 [Dermatophagoides pteronyssinus]